MLLCQPGASIEMHGSLTALANSAEQARTVNTLPLEQYVADVAPSESPSTWAALGGAGPQGQPWGFQQSEAQTVAARSFVEANPSGFGGYADTCDQTCQTYPGMQHETPTSLLAAQATAGQVMVTNGTSSVATTEYSASSGGYSAGAQFPAVVDEGDAVCVSASVCNPNHNWTVTLSATSIDAAYPSIGTFSSLVVTSRNGLGDFGGRVNQLTVNGTSGSVSITGAAFAAAFNLKSTWFSVGNQPGGGAGGYWIDDTRGGIYTFGSAPFYGSMGNIALNKPVVGMAPTSDGKGYWLVASDGGIFTFGDAGFFGSTGNIVLNKPVVGMASTPDGKGYWLVASDGGIFTFGDAGFFGSTGNIVLNKPVVGMVPTHDGQGYWLVASDGGIFSFGDTTFYGSLGASPPELPGGRRGTGGRGYGLLDARSGRDGKGLRKRATDGSRRQFARHHVGEELDDRHHPLGRWSGVLAGRQLGPGLHLRRCTLFRRRGFCRARLFRSCRGDCGQPRLSAAGHLTRRVGLPDHVGEAGEPAQAPEGPQQTGVDAVVGRAQQPQVTAAVPVGPELRLIVTPPEQAVGPQMDDQARIFLSATAVLPFVAAGQEAASADGQTRGQDAVDTEELSRTAHVALRGGGDDDHVVALFLMPPQAPTCVMSQVSPQMLLSERGGAVVDQLGRQPAEEPGEELLLRVVRGRPAHQRGADQLRREGRHRAQHRPHAAQGDEERHDAPSADQRPVEVERRHRSRRRCRPLGRRGLGSGGQIGHERFIESPECGAAPPRAAGEAPGTLERLAAVDDGAPAAGLVHGRLPLGHSPLLQHRHSIRT